MFLMRSDADVNTPAHTRFFSGLDEDFSIRDGLIKSDLLIGEPDPIGVAQGCGSLQAFDQSALILEIVRESRYLVAEGIRSVSVPGERSDLLSLGEKQPGDVSAGVAERSGNYIQFRDVNVATPQAIAE